MQVKHKDVSVFSFWQTFYLQTFVASMRQLCESLLPISGFFLRKMLGTWYGSAGTRFSLILGTR